MDRRAAVRGHETKTSMRPKVRGRTRHAQPHGNPLPVRSRSSDEGSRHARSEGDVLGGRHADARGDPARAAVRLGGLDLDGGIIFIECLGEFCGCGPPHATVDRGHDALVGDDARRAGQAHSGKARLGEARPSHSHQPMRMLRNPFVDPSIPVARASSLQEFSPAVPRPHPRSGPNGPRRLPARSGPLRAIFHGDSKPVSIDPHPLRRPPNRSRPTRAALRGRAPQAAIDSSALRRPLDRSRSPSHAPAGHGIEVSTDLDPSRRPPRAVASSPPCLRRPARSITTALERPVTPRDPVASSLARPPRPPRSIATASGRLDNARSPGFLPHCRLVEARCRKGPQTCSSISTSRRWSGSPRRG